VRWRSARDVGVLGSVYDIAAGRCIGNL